MNKTNYDQILQNYPVDSINEKLAPFITEARKARIDAVINARLHGIQLAIESPSDINNALAAMRSAEALGISCIHLIKPEGSAGAARSITQGAFYWVDIIYHPSLEHFLAQMQSEGIALAGGVINADGPLSDVPIEQPLCIFIGNEARGLTEAAQAACQYRYSIPMVGMSESLNLSVSAAISLYDTSQRKRQKLGANSDLTTQQQSALRAQYYLHSANSRMLPHLFPTQS
jgi:tRNA (guanosine-2'-O-)-methyltransferase